MAEYMRRPEEVLNMFSEALKILDHNTVQYMIEEQQKELMQKDELLKERDAEIEQLRAEVAELKQLSAKAPRLQRKHTGKAET